MFVRTGMGWFMRFAFVIAAAAGIGAVAAFATPASFIQSASYTIDAYRAKAGHIPHDLADLNPIRLAFDVVQQRIREGNSPEQLGFKPSAVTFKPFVMPTTSFDDNRERYRLVYARDPAGWHSAPPR
jgi:hypothetical protein